MLFFTREQLTICNSEANLKPIIEHEVEKNITRYRENEKQVGKQLKHRTNPTIEAKHLIKIVYLTRTQYTADLIVENNRI